MARYQFSLTAYHKWIVKSWKLRSITTNDDNSQEKGLKERGDFSH